MQLRAWRETWMWLAVSACGYSTQAWMMRSGGPTKVSIFDAPPLASADYVATMQVHRASGLEIGLEHGRFRCRPLVTMLERAREFAPSYAEDGSTRLPREILEHTRTCDLAVGRRLRDREGSVFVWNEQGPRWYSAEDLIAAARPIDTAAKALLVVWALGAYQPGWDNKRRRYGTLEDGLVRAVDGGFEVVGSSTVNNCGASSGGEATVYRHVLFVDAKGAVVERGKTVTNQYQITNACHPRGRRPSDFVDVSASSLHEHLLRDMHHEAESVRAFERLARELAAYSAPDELCIAALAAADEERDHARRCAALAGVDVEIASDALPVRSLLELAIDNAREGCVGESYAALAAVVQARCAASAELRAHYAAIAVDELGHAALAHAIDRWVDSRLRDEDRRHVATARAAALAELVPPDDTPLMRELGLPTRSFAAHLVTTVRSLG
jgi:hypothetical protein